jgi:catechol 2,3-dioxygenase
MSAGGYHHHLGTNTWAAGAPLATDDEARLLDWEIVVPDAATVARAAESLENHGADVRREDEAIAARDPWGTTVRVVPAAP